MFLCNFSVSVGTFSHTYHTHKLSSAKSLGYPYLIPYISHILTSLQRLKMQPSTYKYKHVVPTETGQKPEKCYSGLIWKPLGTEHMNLRMENLSRCHVSSILKKKKKKHMSCLLFWTKVIATVQYFCERAPLTLSKATLWFQGCLIIPSFPHTLHTYQHGSLFSVSTSETELRPQLHVLLHFPWQHDLTQGQLCFAAWIQTVTPQAVCLTSDWKAML